MAEVVAVLDHGYVELDAVFGSDLDIVRRARVSTGKGNKTPAEDQRFLDYLWRHQHLSPFGFPQLTFKITMPIAMARQWTRHRTHEMNELSGRYTELAEAYAPTPDRFRLRDTDNRQASGGVLDPELADVLADDMDHRMHLNRVSYRDALEQGVPKEIARLSLPLSTYTTFYWQQSLRNLLHLLHLRLDGHAQWETRQYAEAVYTLTAEQFPWTCAAFERHTLNAVTLSSDEYALLLDAVHGEPGVQAAVEYLLANDPTYRDLNENGRRRREFLAKLEYDRDGEIS